MKDFKRRLCSLLAKQLTERQLQCYQKKRKASSGATDTMVEDRERDGVEDEEVQYAALLKMARSAIPTPRILG